MIAVRQWLMVPLEPHGPHAVRWHACLTRCSASQPSQRRSQRLRQHPRPRLKRDEALRKLEQEQREVEEEPADFEEVPIVFELGTESDDEEDYEQQQRRQPPSFPVRQSGDASQQAPQAKAALEVADSRYTRHPEAAALELLNRRSSSSSGGSSLEERSPAQRHPLHGSKGAAAAPAGLRQPPEQRVQQQARQPHELPVQEAQQAQQAERELVEADEVWDPTVEPATLLQEISGEEVPAAPDSKSAALLEILDSGDQIEECIQRHRDEIDEAMLQLLAQRIQLAATLEQEKAVEGLQLLYRRLKAEVDRKSATPAMRLLDDLINILDPASDEAGDLEDEDEGYPAATAATGTTAGASGGAPAARGLGVAMLADQEERRARAVAHMQATFGMGLPQDANVLSLAAQLAEGGEQVADGLFGETVDPDTFLKEVGALLDKAAAEKEKVVEYLEQLGPEQEQHRIEVEVLLEQREQAMALVEEVQQLVATFRHRQQQEQLRKLVR